MSGTVTVVGKSIVFTGVKARPIQMNVSDAGPSAIQDLPGFVSYVDIASDEPGCHFKVTFKSAKAAQAAHASMLSDGVAGVDDFADGATFGGIEMKEDTKPKKKKQKAAKRG